MRSARIVSGRVKDLFTGSNGHKLLRTKVGAPELESARGYGAIEAAPLVILS
jgi:hypothetical protein